MSYKPIDIKNILKKLDNDEELNLSEKRFYEKYIDDCDFIEKLEKPKMSFEF